MIPSSELILRNNNTVFHLNLQPYEIADTIILVGDPDRVPLVSSFFDKITVNRQNREFSTHTGYFQNKLFSVISTGIGVGNIDIVMNELDALVNVDLTTRKIKTEKKSLKIVRLGTCGGLQPETPEGSIISSNISIGLDGLLNFYADRNAMTLRKMEEIFLKHTHLHYQYAKPYCVAASKELIKLFSPYGYGGITVSAPGFYAPQGRVVRLNLTQPDLINLLSSFSYEGLKITNLEMESSAVAGLAKLLGHQAITLCVVIANRYAQKTNINYGQRMKELIQITLTALSENCEN